MRPIAEQIDEFIEGLFDGSILMLTKKLLTSGKASQDLGFTPETTQRILEHKDMLIGQLIPKYLESKQKEKKDLGKQIFQTVLHGRSIGIINNDENLPKELNWYRIQNQRLNKENEKLHESVKDLTKTVLDLSNISKDQKVGIR